MPNIAPEAGQELTSLLIPPISRTTLALFAGASGDHNPIHIDLDFARQSGLDDVFVQGMLPMAYLGRLVTNNFPDGQLQKFSARFRAITPVHASLNCTGKISEVAVKDTHTLLELQLEAATTEGFTTLLGTAQVAFPHPSHGD